MIYGHSAFQKLFRMESDPEMRFGSSWGQVDALFRLKSITCTFDSKIIWSKACREHNIEVFFGADDNFLTAIVSKQW
jgi:hypothetical protein